MFNLKFGIFWTAFTTLIFVLLFFYSNEFNIGIALFLGLFEFIGISLIVSGAKTVITDKKTDAYGTSTFGIVTNILETGAYVNNIPEVKAEILAYLPGEGRAQTFFEIIGMAPSKYNIGDYLTLVVYENDINIVQITEKKFIPNDILDSLESSFEKKAPQTIEINGVQYIRQDTPTNYNY